MIDQLSEICQISVNYINKGAAQIRLGNTGSGPVIVEPESAVSSGANQSPSTIPISIITQGTRLQPVVGTGNVATNQIQGGIIAGLVDAYALADDTLKEIDALAKLLSKKFNEVTHVRSKLRWKKRFTDVYSIKFRGH